MSEIVNHGHEKEAVKLILDRMSRAIGHFSAVKRMVEEDQDCSEVLIQLAAVKSAMINIEKEILKQHISHCIIDAVKSNDLTALEALNNAIDRFIK